MAVHHLTLAETSEASPTPLSLLDRHNQRRADGLSTSLQLAKASEHLACADLMLQGWNAFLADAGLPYDIVADWGEGRFWRIQVKSTWRMMPERTIGRGDKARIVQPTYRFALRRSRCGDRRITLDACDYLALVALEARIVAWVPVAHVVLPDGRAFCSIEFKSRQVAYRRTSEWKGGCDPTKHGRWIEDYAAFRPALTVRRTAGNE